MASVTSNTTPKRRARTHRPSLIQPQLGLPVFAKSERAYHRYIENPPDRNPNREDYGMDNFSYYESHMADFKVTWGLIPRLPSSLREHAKLFILSLAAVYTALDRIDDMDKEAYARTDPATTHHHLMNHHASDYIPAVVGAETPQSSTPTPILTRLSTPTSSTQPIKKPLMQPNPQLPVNMFGMESPPITPIDSKVANTPVNDPLLYPTAWTLDLEHANAKLRTKATRPLASPTLPVKNEIAWMSYVRQYNAEIADLKHVAVPRVKGYERLIHQALYHVPKEEGLTEEQKSAVQGFRAWWAEFKPKMGELRERVKGYEERALETRAESDGRDEAKMAHDRWF